MGFAKRMLAGRLGSDLKEVEGTSSGLLGLRLLGGKIGFDVRDFDQNKMRRDNSFERIAGSVEKDIYLWEPKSLRIRAINWWHVFVAEYVSYAYPLTIAGVVVFLLAQFWYGYIDTSLFIKALWDPITIEVIALVAIIMAYMSSWKPAIYCVENVVFVPPARWQVSQSEIMEVIESQGCYSELALDFQRKILSNSGTGESTHWPPAILRSKEDPETQCNMAAAREEAKEVIFSLVRDVFKNTGVKPKAIDFLIINCSLFCPTPSLCALVCNEFCLRQDVRTYNLGGMGCSANVVSVDLAKQLLENRPGSRALVISTESISQSLYRGNDRGMLLQNTLFRCGGCALLLSSRRVDALRAKYKLLYSFRTQLSDTNSYNCVFQKEDAEGNSGVALSKDIVTVAGKAMRQNFIQLGPYILSIREQIVVVLNHFVVSLLTMAKKKGWPWLGSMEVPKGYTPNFSKTIDHFCIHAGGRAVIEGVKKNLKLTDRQVAPSVQTLFDWGNTSSSSIWYELDWIERFGNLQKGERILQIAFGSGFKCNSAVWVALRVNPKKRQVSLKQSATSAPPPAEAKADAAQQKPESGANENGQ